jgi:diamine N-acetyltransferase
MKLRAVELGDADLIFRWENDQQNWDVAQVQRPFSFYAIENYVYNAQNEDIYTAKQLRLMIEIDNGKTTVGCVDLYDFEPQNNRAGIGILIDKEFRAKGYAFEALNLLKQYAFSILNIHNIYAFVPCENQGSRRLFAKCDFSQTAVLRHWIFREGKYQDVVVYQYLS